MNAVQLRMARAALRWGVRELAERAGVTANTVTRIENGRTRNNPPWTRYRKRWRLGVLSLQMENDLASACRPVEVASPPSERFHIDTVRTEPLISPKNISRRSASCTGERRGVV
jgi:transcriptional regulator with XRE-family HTH domain